MVMNSMDITNNNRRHLHHLSIKIKGHHHIKMATLILMGHPHMVLELDMVEDILSTPHNSITRGTICKGMKGVRDHRIQIYLSRSYGNMNSGHYQNGGQMGPPSVQYGGHHNGHSGYHGHNNGYPGPAGDYAVQKWNNMASFNNMKAVDWDKVTNLIQIVKNFYTEALSVSARTTEEVTDWRKKNSVRVVGTANMKPILTFEEACIPPYLMNIIRRKNFESSLSR